MLSIQLFGGIALIEDGGPVSGPAVQRRRLALLALLAASPTRGVSRDKLTAYFWPEEPRDRARHFLADSVFTLRRQLGKECVLSVGEDLVLNSEVVRADVREFHDALGRGDPEGAVALYRGPFLDGFFVSDAPEFERWADAERDRLARTYAEALEGLARGSVGRGEHERAAQWWSRLAAHDPVDSRIALELMRALAAAGATGRAVQHARVHATLLRDELDAGPDPAVEAYAAELARAPAPVPAPALQAPTPAGEAMPAPPPPGDPAAPAAPPLTPTSRVRRRWAVAAAGATLLLLVIVATAAWMRREHDGEAAEGAGGRTPVALAIFPFAVRGGADYQYLAEGMVTLLGAGIDGSGGLRVLDPYMLLGDPAEVGARTQPSPVEAAELASAEGADLFLLGTVVESGGKLRVSASLYGDGAEPLTVATAGDDPFAVADEISRQLLAGRFRDPAGRLAQLATRTTRSLPALKAYLDGEREFYAARYDLAAAAFRRAVREDRSFALAHYRLSTAAEWSFRFTEARQAAESARRFSGALGAHDQQLIAAWHAFVSGDADTAERLYDALLVEDPGDVEAWSGLGEVRAHYNPVRGRPVREAIPAFRKVLQLAPSYGEARFHMLELAAADGQVAAFDSLLAGVDPRSAQRLSWEAARAMSWGSGAQRAGTLARLGRADEVVIGIAGVRAAANFRSPAGAEKIVRLLIASERPRGWQAAGRIILAQAHLVRGDWSAARAQLDSARVIEPAWALEIGALGALLPGMPVGTAELRALRDELQLWDPARSTPELAFFFATHADAHAQLRLYLLALLSGRLGDESAVARYADRLRGAGETREGREFGRSLLLSVEADRAARGGDAEAALRLLEQAKLDAPLERVALSPFFAQAFDRYRRAELLAVLGRPAEALRWYQSLTDGPDLLFWPAAHRRQQALLARLGRGEEARVHAESLRALRIPAGVAPVTR